MAIDYDNFEAYALGNTTNPFGNFTRNSNPAQIVADNYVTAGSKCLRTTANGASVSWSSGGAGLALYGSATVWVAIKFDTFLLNAGFFHFYNGNPYAGGGSNSQPLFTLGMNMDSTLSAYAPNSGLVAVPIAVSPIPFSKSKWYWLQVNITLADVAGFVSTTFEVSIEGLTIMSGSVTSGVAVAALLSGTAQFDYVTFDNTTKLDEFTIDTLAAIGTYPNPGTPSARVSTSLAEVIEATTSANAVVSTGLIELIVAGGGYVYEA